MPLLRWLLVAGALWGRDAPRTPDLVPPEQWVAAVAAADFVARCLLRGRPPSPQFVARYMADHIDALARRLAEVRVTAARADAATARAEAATARVEAATAQADVARLQQQLLAAHAAGRARRLTLAHIEAELRAEIRELEQRQELDTLRDQLSERQGEVSSLCQLLGSVQQELSVVRGQLQAALQQRLAAQLQAAAQREAERRAMRKPGPQ